MEPLTEQDVRHILAEAFDEIAKSFDSARFGGVPKNARTAETDAESLRKAIKNQAKKLRKG